MPRHPLSLFFLLPALGLVAALSLAATASGAPPVKIGVLAFRPKPQTLAKWQPLAASLHKALPGYDFEVEPLTYPELNQAVADHRLHFVLTNSGHYVLLKKRFGLSSPLATLIAEEGGRPATVFGGVIFRRADRREINSLEEIRGKTVAAVNNQSLGGYQMQAYELSRKGIRVPQDVTLLTTGMPHDKVITAVLDGRADLGFIRSGVLESMSKEGRLESGLIKIINPQHFTDFPSRISTRLYPEWPFAAMPTTDENLARHVAATLFVLEGDVAATSAMDIHGFTVPADYGPVEDLLRELRLPPFDQAPTFTAKDIWSRYRLPILGGLTGLGIILILGVSLALTHRNLARKHQQMLAQQRLLQESEEKLRTVADYTLDWEYWQSPQGEILYMNPTCDALTGYTRDEFIADPDLLLRVIHPEDREEAGAHLRNHANHQDGVLSFRVIRRDGAIRWVEHFCHAVWSDDGIFKGRRVSNRDITRRNLTERQLAANEEKYKLLFDSAGDAIFIHDEQARMLEVNQRAMEQYGYTRDELLTMTIDKVDAPEESEHAPDRIATLMRQGFHAFETTHLRNDGSRLRVEVNARRILWNGTPAMMSICRDITERRLLEEERATLEARYQQLHKTESLARMAGAIAHHYNNMLAVVIGNLELGLNITPPETQAGLFMTDAIKGARRAAEVSSLMLTYLGQDPGKREAFDLAAACRHALPRLKATLPEAVELTTDLPSPGPVITANTGHLRQLLANLITNAWEAIGEMPGAIRLTVKTAAPGDIPATHRFPIDWRPQETEQYACLEVHDSGCGIAEQVIDTLIFDPFFTTKFTGRGLGLPVVLGIVRSYQGVITVASEISRGSVFRVYLPMEG